MRIDDRLLNTQSPNQNKTSIKTLACLGDSWTDDYWLGVAQGTYYKRPNPFGHWTHIIEREMRIPIYNYGITGDTANNIAHGANNRMGEVLNLKPSHVTVMIGGNDMYNKATSDQIMANITIITETMLVNNIQVILMWYPISPGGGPPGNPTLEEQWQCIIEVRNKLSIYAASKNLLFVDFFNTAMYNGVNGVNMNYYLPDGIHANTAGMPIIANYLMSQINKQGV